MVTWSRNRWEKERLITTEDKNQSRSDKKRYAMEDAEKCGDGREGRTSGKEREFIPSKISNDNFDETPSQYK